MKKHPEIWQESRKFASPDTAYHLCKLTSQISECCYFAGWLLVNVWVNTHWCLGEFDENLEARKDDGK